LRERFGIRHVLMTPSCTAALELAAILCNLDGGDEVIMPSFTFVSTANAVVRAGATPVFVDICPETLNIDPNRVEEAIGPKTRAIFPVHYAGVGCEMDDLMAIASRFELPIVEDAAQGVNAWFKDRALGSIGNLGAFSFHETKNYICGEGGALCINDESLLDRAHVLRDKGTDRQRFLVGEVDKYRWVDVGSSYVPSELACAFLYGQLEKMDDITQRRERIFLYYMDRLRGLAEDGLVRLPVTPAHCRANYHLFYIVLSDETTRDDLAAFLAERSIQAITHYEPLHSSPMGLSCGKSSGSLTVTRSVAARLLRLPLFYEITESQQDRVVEAISEFFERAHVSASASPGSGSDVAKGPVA
jgi:dTDP-4-amino-4,6-dideoxygalactose transaminase